MLKKQEKLPLEGESVQLHQRKILDKILFQIQLPPIGDLLPFGRETTGIDVLTVWIPFCSETTGIDVPTVWIPFSRETTGIDVLTVWVPFSRETTVSMYQLHGFLS